MSRVPIPVLYVARQLGVEKPQVFWAFDAADAITRLEAMRRQPMLEGWERIAEVEADRRAREANEAELRRFETVSADSSIEWTDTTWNPVTGCDRVSPGCANCYALDLAARLKGMGQKRYQRDGDPKSSGPGFGLTLHPDKLEEPLRWRKPRMVFVNSMSDLFHEEIPDEYIADVFNVMAKAQHHIFQVLTKRPERMREFLAGTRRCEHVWLTHNGHNPISYGGDGLVLNDGHGWPLPNVWLGVSIENRRFVHRADLLRETPAAVRFISAEPLLGPLVPDGSDDPDDHPWQDTFWSDGYEGSALDLTDIDWLIVGGESGPGHRLIDPDWVHDLRNACTQSLEFGESRTAFFFKQDSGLKPGHRGRFADVERFPQEFPQVREAVSG